jgi:hypothetical protein
MGNVAEFGTDLGTFGTEEERVVILNLLVGEAGPVSISGLIAVPRLVCEFHFFFEICKG